MINPAEGDQALGAHTAQARAVDPRNALNDLTAPEWISETVSVWRQKGLGAGHADAAIEKLHPAPFSFTDVARLIRFFTKPGQTVLDPFVGIGSTLKAAALEGRAGIGVELNPDFAALTRERLADEVERSALPQELLEGDARAVLPGLADASVDFVVTSPPYWNILSKADHKVRQERTAHGLRAHYGDDVRDLANIPEYNAFLDALSNVFTECFRALRGGGYACPIVGDFRHGSRYFMFHSDLATRLEEIGFSLKGITILYQPHKRVFPYGYPFAFVPNLHHQYILILRKP